MSLSPRLDHSSEAWLDLNPGQLTVRDRVRERLADGTYGTEEVSCFCGSAESHVVAARDRYGLPVETHLCVRCGLLRTSPRMDANATQLFYEQDYRALYTEVGKEILFRSQYQKGLVFSQKLLQIPGIERVYEIGCGAGGILKPFAEAGLTAVGCDYDGDYLEEGRRHGVELVFGNVEALLSHQQGEVADLVILIHVVEHFLDLEAELSAIISALAPGGILCVEVPGVRSIETDYCGDILLYLQNAHNYHFTAGTLSYVLSSLGLNILTADESVLLIAQKPCSLVEYQPAPLPSEATSTLRFLGRMERTFLTAVPSQSKEEAQAP